MTARRRLESLLLHHIEELGALGHLALPCALITGL